MYELYMLKSIQASIEAGNAILDVYHSDFTVEHKADHTPLTLADKRSHEIIVAYLTELDIPVLSEEGKGIPYEERKTWDKLWIVDPLDGTKEFIKRNGEFTVNIALVQGGRAVLGVVLVPERDALYFAAQDLGTYKLKESQILSSLSRQIKENENGRLLSKIINHSTKLPLEHPAISTYTIIGSRSHPSAELKTFIEEKQRQHGSVEFISAGSALKFCLMAEGRADIYPRLGPTMEWDTAAGQVVAEGAGAKVLRCDNGEPLMYNKQDLVNPWFIVSGSHAT